MVEYDSNQLLKFHLFFVLPLAYINLFYFCLSRMQIFNPQLYQTNKNQERSFFHKHIFSQVKPLKNVTEC